MIELRVNKQLPADVIVTEWQDLDISCTPPDGINLALTIEGAGYTIPLLPFLHPGDPSWHWQWTPRNTTGLVRLALKIYSPDGHIEQQHTPLTIAPRKLEQHHYEMLLDDLQRMLFVLLFTLRGSTTQAGMVPPSDMNQEDIPLLEIYTAFFVERSEELERAVSHIVRSPHTHLQHTTRRVPLGMAHTLVHPHDSLAFHMASNAERMGLHSEVVEPYSQDSADTYENRLLKHLLNELWRRVQTLTDIAAAQPSDRRAHTYRCADGCHKHLVEYFQSVGNRLHTLRTLPMLADVGTLNTIHGPTHVIRCSPAYRQVYRLWQELRRLPSVTVDTAHFSIPINDVAHLYEYWCVLQVVLVLLALPDAQIVQQQLVPHTAWSAGHGPWNLVVDAPLLVLLWRGLRLRLRYQPRYRPPSGSNPHSPLVSLDHRTHIPDLVLEIAAPSRPPMAVVFDAKYRLTPVGNVPEDALADAYTYLGSIGRTDGTHVVVASTIFSPYIGLGEHYASGVGVLPLLPGHRDALCTWLPAILEDIML